MRKRLIIIFISIVLFLSGCIVPPRPPRAIVPPLPHKIWMPGHWNAKRVWVPGHWKRSRR